MYDISSLKYLIPKVNTLNNDINNIISNDSILTDNFCVMGADSSSGYDDDDNPITGSSPALAYTYDGLHYLPSSNNILYK